MSTEKPKERCTECGHLTEVGRNKRAKQAKESPIYGTDLSRPKHVIIEEIRSRLAAIRGSVTDFIRAFPAWKERVEHAEGGITCIISALHSSAQELKEFHEKHELKATPAEESEARA